MLLKLKRSEVAKCASDMKHICRQLATEDECMMLYIDNGGRLLLELGTTFGWDEKSESTPSVTFSLIDLIRDHFEFAGWLHEASEDSSHPMTAQEAMVFASPFRKHLNDCITLIDKIETILKEEDVKRRRKKIKSVPSQQTK